MECRQMISLALGQGETRQMLVEAKTMVLVTKGSIALRTPLMSLAETVVAQALVLEAEQLSLIERGGWINLHALSATGVVLIPPEGVALWRQVGRCLEALFGTDKAKLTKA